MRPSIIASPITDHLFIITKGDCRFILKKDYYGYASTGRAWRLSLQSPSELNIATFVIRNDGTDHYRDDSYQGKLWNDFFDIRHKVVILVDLVYEAYHPVDNLDHHIVDSTGESSNLSEHKDVKLINATLSIDKSLDLNYPGIDIDVVLNNNNDTDKPNPRILIEESETDGVRVLVWNNPESEDYSDVIRIGSGANAKWEEAESVSFGKCLKCSNCKSLFTTGGLYCPNCGCKMR